MSYYELLLAIKDYSNDNIQETIEQANELLMMIMDNPKKFELEFSKEIEELADKHNVCPTCGVKLNEIISKEKSEYLGQEVEENIYTYECENCNFVK